MVVIVVGVVDLVVVVVFILIVDAFVTWAGEKQKEKKEHTGLENENKNSLDMFWPSALQSLSFDVVYYHTCCFHPKSTVRLCVQ